jgi:hypothetical protein
MALSEPIRFVGLLCGWFLFLLAPVQSVQASDPRAIGLGIVPDRRFESITILGQTYRDVTVYSQNESTVVLKHDLGITGLKVSNLDNPTLRRLGYHVEEPEPDPPFIDLSSLTFLSWMSGSDRLLQLSTLTLLGLIVATVGLYLYTSYLFWLICVKTETSPGIAVWLPVFQIFPLLRAARMSRLWAVGLAAFTLVAGYALHRHPEYALLTEIVASLAFLVGWTWWALRISQARHKSVLTAVFLLLPGINYLALLYLAGSR